MGLCTGTLVGSRFVLTAGHCVIDRNSGQLLDDLDFYPAKNQDLEPYGKYAWEYAFVSENFYITKDSRYDYALIVLEKPVQDIQPMSFAHECDTRLTFTLNIVGYPFDKNPSDAQWTTSCNAVKLNCTQKIFQHNCDTMKGMSGAPMFVYRRNDNPQFSIRSIHIAALLTNQPIGVINLGVILTEEIIYQLNQWMAAFEDQQ
eukprot:TRINITY_DN21123_c0_g1_i5.p4 TRINITY_DN21123_c0_g1~~TRINITY_DN21123_c0_g1_i5.p4  ORF type:complete len:202 (+),score=8.13 TRINITY_DN21123_c0_g1_i5:621-1226(+)